jgi:superfamily II DNA or RNA helicase
MNRRFFSRAERRVLFDLADGKCSICGEPLGEDFHADHIVPYARGGVTDVANGQAVCVRCNSAKGATMAEFPYDLRGWQVEAYDAYRAGGSNVLINATPGAGKTLFALYVAHQEMLITGNAKFLVVVVPTDALRIQWQREATQVGIHLATEFDARAGLASDYHGVVTTYQTIAARARETRLGLRAITSRQRTLAVIDEIHHVGESKTWGDALTEALSPCYSRLLITGTPFRNDRNIIPFVEYETLAGGGLQCKPNYSYGYGQALRDNVVRPVYFQTFDGDVSWFTDEGEHITASLDDELPQREAAQRHRHLYNPNGDFLKTVLNDAHEQLLKLRADDPRAGGLIVTQDTKHAWAVARVLESIVGHQVTVVVSRDARGDFILPGVIANQLDRYRNGTDDWLIAVKMVSEGVDIKRLRVGVWATNVESPLFFRQVVGRILRVDSRSEESQTAHMYIPRLPAIVQLAEEMEQERAHVIDDLDSIADDLEGMDDDEEREPIRPRLTSMFDSTSGFAADLIHNATQYTTAELERARVILAEMNEGLATTQIVLIARTLRHLGMNAPDEPAQRSAPADKPLEQQKHELRRKGGAITRRGAILVELSNGDLTHDQIARAINNAQNVVNINACSLDQLHERVRILDAWLEAWRHGNRDFTPKGFLRQQSVAFAD